LRAHQLCLAPYWNISENVNSTDSRRASPACRTEKELREIESRGD
jgi:hypothetical protein